MYEARRQRSSWARIKLSIVCNKDIRILAGIDVRFVAYQIFKNLAEHSRETYFSIFIIANFISEIKKKFYKKKKARHIYISLFKLTQKNLLY